MRWFENNLYSSSLKRNIFNNKTGDLNDDLIIDIFDMAMIDNDSYNSVNGNVSTDLNGDSMVNSLDMAIADNNQLILTHLFS